MKRHLMRMLLGTSVLVGGLISDVGVGAAQAQHYGGHGGNRGGFGGNRGGFGGNRGGFGGNRGGFGGNRGGFGGRGGYWGGDGGLGRITPLDVAPDLGPGQE
jgi:hypothetical protein